MRGLVRGHFEVLHFLLLPLKDLPLYFESNFLDLIFALVVRLLWWGRAWGGVLTTLLGVVLPKEVVNWVLGFDALD